jgi:hypothetical protein
LLKLKLKNNVTGKAENKNKKKKKPVKKYLEFYESTNSENVLKD